MKTETTITFIGFAAREWDVLTHYPLGKHKTVVVIKATENGDHMTVVYKGVSNNKYIRSLQIKYLKFKKYLYDKYKRSEQKNSHKQSSGDRSACNNSL